MYIIRPFYFPSALPTYQTGLDLFIIVMIIFNALERPHKKQAEVITALQHDGAKMFVASGVFLRLLDLGVYPLLQALFGKYVLISLSYGAQASAALRLVSLIMAIVGTVSRILHMGFHCSVVVQPAYCFVTLTCATIFCRT